MIKLFAAITTLLLVGIACGQVRNPPALPVGPDWAKAYAHAKAGKHVQLVVLDIKNVNSKHGTFHVELVDGNDIYHIASAAEYPKGAGGNYLFDLSHTLKQLKKAPSQRATIRLVGADFRIYEVNLK